MQNRRPPATARRPLRAAGKSRSDSERCARRALNLSLCRRSSHRHIQYSCCRITLQARQLPSARTFSCHQQHHSCGGTTVKCHGARGAGSASGTTEPPGYAATAAGSSAPSHLRSGSGSGPWPPDWDAEAGHGSHRMLLQPRSLWAAQVAADQAAADASKLGTSLQGQHLLPSGTPCRHDHHFWLTPSSDSRDRHCGGSDAGMTDGFVQSQPASGMYGPLAPQHMLSRAVASCAPAWPPSNFFRDVPCPPPAQPKAARSLHPSPGAATPSSNSAHDSTAGGRHYGLQPSAPLLRVDAAPAASGSCSAAGVGSPHRPQGCR